MKIGILTHHYVNNFGAFLQAYALREALAEEYPKTEVEIIDYVNIRQYLINSCGWFRYYKDRENFACWLEKIRVPLTFIRARKRDMRRSVRCYTARQVNRQKYDVIIIGSDEVWNYQDWKSADKIKFAHGLTCGKIIAYAPSVGNSDGKVPDYVVEGIRRFTALSVRDTKTKALVQNVTRKAAVTVLDPTFLTTIPVSAPKCVSKPYILFYYCDHLPCSIRDQIFQYARVHGLAVYGAGECCKEYDSITVNLMPFEWVWMFKNAAFVFTGTFHGAVFSILHHKPFKVYLTNKSRIQKVTALLNECGIADRQIDDKFFFNLEDMRDEIDYQTVDRLLSNKRKKSIEYLKAAIGE